MANATHLTTPELFDAGQLEIEGDAYRHLFRARRLAAGDGLRVVDGRGRARSGQIESVNRSRAIVTLGFSVPSLEPSIDVHVLVGALRPERASWLVEKATEMGATSITFFSSERTPRAYGQAKLDRLRRVARSALEQCGRAKLPEIAGVLEIEEALDQTLDKNPMPIYALMPGGEPLTTSVGQAEELSLVIGPEGGFGPADEQLLASSGIRGCRLGETILRVETAAIAALALVLCR